MRRIATTGQVWVAPAGVTWRRAGLRHDCDTTAGLLRRADGSIGVMTDKYHRTRVLTALVLLACLATGCSLTRGSAGDATGPADSVMSPVLLLGDSVAAGQALPMTQAFAASGVRFRSIASEGGGNVVGPFADENWKKLPEQIAAADPAVVIYQITTFDWGSEQEQRAGYERLSTTVTDVGAELVFVTMPPIDADDFYRPYLSDLERAPDVARAVAERSGGRTHLLDASEVWGDAYQQTRDGRPDRSADGIHTCPQGAARFTSWLLSELAQLHPGFVPAPAQDWANTGWASDDRFIGC